MPQNMDIKKLLSRKAVTSHHVNSLWADVSKNGLKIEILREILTCYIHNKVSVPVTQKEFNMLLSLFNQKKLIKKLKVLVFHIIEEMCYWIDADSIVNTILMSSSTAMTVELLNCLTINNHLTIPDVTVFVRLQSSLSSSDLSHEDRCKLIAYLVSESPPSIVRTLNQQMTLWLRYSRLPSSSQFFSWSSATEVDGTTATGICTALTLASSLTESHIMSISTFSLLRTYLSRQSVQEIVGRDFLSVVAEHCSIMLEQAFREAILSHDKSLQVAVVNEIVNIIGILIKLDLSFSTYFDNALVRATNRGYKKCDPMFVIRLWSVSLDLGKQNDLTNTVLGDILSQVFIQSSICFEIITVILEKLHHLSYVHNPHSLALYMYYPNLLKTIATHPSSLVEEYLIIIQHLAARLDYCVQIFHDIIDLPVISATVCVDQTRVLQQTGLQDPLLVSAMEVVFTEFTGVYNHFMKSKLSDPDDREFLGSVVTLYHGYFMALEDLRELGLVQYSSHIAPLLLEVYLNSVETQGLQEIKLLLPHILNRSCLIYSVPGYVQAVNSVMLRCLHNMINHYPVLLLEPCILPFLLNRKNAVSSTQLYKLLVYAVPQYYSHVCENRKFILDFFEIMESSFYEILTEGYSDDCYHIQMVNEITFCLASATRYKTFIRFVLKRKQTVDLALLTLASVVAVDHLRRVTINCNLSCKHTELMPRAVMALEKLTVLLKKNKSTMNKYICEELSLLLQNPIIGNIVMDTREKVDYNLENIIRFLSQFSENRVYCQAK